MINDTQLTAQSNKRKEPERKEPERKEPDE
jgi:hypothetical protein